MLVSYWTGTNYTLEQARTPPIAADAIVRTKERAESDACVQASRSLWALILLHHTGAIGLCALGLHAGEATPRDAACRLASS